MDIENFIYEAKPFLCMGMAIYALAASEPSRLVILLAGLLLVVGGWILRMRWKARHKGGSIEGLIYETQPFLYLGLGIWAVLTQHHSKLAIACSLILFACGIVILKWRQENRR